MRSERSKAAQQYREELKEIRRQMLLLGQKVSAGVLAPQEAEEKKRLLQNLADCCRDNLAVLATREKNRVLSYSGSAKEKGDGSNRIFYLAQTTCRGRDNSQNRMRVLASVQKILHQELSPKTREILLRSFAGESEQSIAQTLGVNVSTVSRSYQKGIHALKRYCGYLEGYLR